MSNIPTELKYTEQHEWIKMDGDTATIGITDYAQEQLTDIVFVELPEEGRLVKAGEGIAVLESVKSVSDVFAPLTGEVVEVNEDLENHPEWVNEDPFGTGWIYKLKTASTNLSGMMDGAVYEKYLSDQE